jgi:hypothetical protein
MEELKVLTFDLAVDWDELSGDIKSLKVLSLIKLLGQQKRLPELIAKLREERPNTYWPDVPETLVLPPPQPLTRQGRVRQAVMRKVRSYWIEGVLDRSLYQVSRIELGMEYDTNVVDRPWMMTLARPLEGERVIPVGMSITELFFQLGGSMLILGEPGSGKTTTLLELTRDLLDIAELDESQPIPLVLNLSSWTKRHSPLSEWLIEELRNIYQVSKKYASNWLESEPFRLLLDGLDEVEENDRNGCVEAINAYRQDFGLTDIVVCSRKEEYESLRVQLKMLGAIYLLPLEQEQIDLYLDNAGEPLVGVREAIKTDDWLRDMTQSPLMLSIIALAYHNRGPSEASALSPTEKQLHLFTTYIQRMFERRRVDLGATQEDATKWLGYLSSQMHQRSLSIFLVEQLQFDWLLTLVSPKRG